MSDRLSNIGLILSKCLEGADIIESSDSVTPELLGLGESLTLKSGELLGIASEEAGHLEQELIEKGTTSACLPQLRDYLADLQSAASCLAVHIKIVRTFLEWTQDEEKLKSVDEGLAFFSGALDEAKALEPPDSISELRRTHESILKNLESYVQLYNKIKEGKDKGDARILEEASSELAELESEQILDSTKMFSLKDALEKAQVKLVVLIQEVKDT